MPESWPALPDLDGDGTVDVFDCNPLDADIYSGAPELPDCEDNDCDGWIPAAEFDDWDGDGALACHDCDDGDASRSPGLPESCDGVDNDCSGLLGPDEFDVDGDGFRPCDGDCDDWSAAAHPGAVEVCDGADNDCNGAADYSPDERFDLDGDGFVGCMDCDDWNPTRNPGMQEICNGVDDDCDGILLPGPPGEATDADVDGWVACADCDDGDPSVHPWAQEVCDGIDDDCSGLLGPDEFDADEDGFRPCDGDCDDLDSSAYPGGPEVCDGVDNDCDGVLLACEAGPTGPDLPTTSAQAVTWITNHAEDPSVCPAGQEASFAGQRPPVGFPSVLEPAPSGSAHLLQAPFPTTAFWLDYLHCREVIASTPASLETGPEQRFCDELALALDGLPADPWADFYELAVGVPLNMPPGVRHGWYSGGNPAPPVPVTIGGSEDATTWFVGTAAPSGPPEAKLHAFDGWQASLAAANGLQDDLGITLGGYVHLGAFDLDLAYSPEPAGSPVNFVETVPVPEWSWSFVARFSASDWTLASVTAEPAEIGGDGLDLGTPFVGLDAQAAGLTSARLAEHALAMTGVLVEETLRDRLEVSTPTLRAFFDDFVFETNPVLWSSASNCTQTIEFYDPSIGEVVSVPIDCPPTRQILAVDKVERDQTWDGYVTTHPASCADPGGDVGLAMILTADVAEAVLLVPPPGTLLAASPGFREIVLDSDLAQAMAGVLRLGEIDEQTTSSGVAIPLGLWGDRASGWAGERWSVLERSHLGALLHDFLTGYLGWSYAPQIDAFGCAVLAGQVEDACLLGPAGVDACEEQADDLWTACTASPGWDANEQIVIDPPDGGDDDDSAIELPLWSCGSVQSAELLSLALAPGTVMDEVCGGQEPPRFESDLAGGEIEFRAAQCAVATATLAVGMNLVVYDTNLYTAPGGGCPAILDGTDRQDLRMGPAGDPGPLWEDSLPAGGQPGIFSEDLELMVDLELGVVIDWSVPLGRQGLTPDPAIADADLVGWDPVYDWYDALMRPLDLGTAINDAVPPGTPATAVTISFQAPDESLTAVPDSGHIDTVRGTFPWACLYAPGALLCDAQATVFSLAGDVPAEALEYLAGDRLDEMAFSDDLPAPQSIPLPNIAPQAFTELKVMPTPPDQLLPVDGNGNVGDWDGLGSSLVGPVMGYLGVGSDPTMFLAMYASADARRRSMIDDEDFANDPMDPIDDANTAVWVVQALAYGLRIDEMGWPTREAVWRAIMEQDCNALDLPSSGPYPPKTVDCVDDVLVDVVGPSWADGAAGAIWLFRPDPQVFGPPDPAHPNPLWSGAAWKPGRLPSP